MNIVSASASSKEDVAEMIGPVLGIPGEAVKMHLYLWHVHLRA